jgi:amidase
MTRFVMGGVIVAATLAAAAQSPEIPGAGVPGPRVDVAEQTIDQLQAGMAAGTYSARQIAEAYLARIDAIDRKGPTLSSVIETNPDALTIADELDRERREKGPRGPMHGIPVLLKDNIDTADKMMTTAGSLALVGPAPDRDAFLVERLRAAGAVILGKTNLSEWANFRSTKSTSGWSARGGLVRNPYALDRNACGSSSGTGTAISASLAAVGVGTETDGSIVCPSSATGLVGVKPTLGLVSRSGIVPIAHSQDTAGPMTRTVRDAAILLGAMTGVDPRDEATAASRDHSRADYKLSLDADGLKGARIGIARKRVSGYSPATDRIFEAAIEAMKELGAVIVDPADVPHIGEYDEGELEILLYEFKADLNEYLSQRKGMQVRTLKDIIAFNEREREREMPFFGQELFEQAEKKGPLTEKAYVTALARNRRLAGRLGIDAVIAKHRLDALVMPTLSPAWTTDLVNGDHFLGASSTPAAVAGYPSVTVPAGFAFGLPVGVSFVGRAWSEPTLLKFAYAYEQATKHRRPPTFAATVDTVPQGSRN